MEKYKELLSLIEEEISIYRSIFKQTPALKKEMFKRLEEIAHFKTKFKFFETECLYHLLNNKPEVVYDYARKHTIKKNQQAEDKEDDDSLFFEFLLMIILENKNLDTNMFYVTLSSILKQSNKKGLNI